MKRDNGHVNKIKFLKNSKKSCFLSLNCIQKSEKCMIKQISNSKLYVCTN